MLKLASLKHLLFRSRRVEPLFDINDVLQVNAELNSRGEVPLSIYPADADRDVDGAARFIISTLICNRAVRRHYPSALHDGPDSDFAAYIFAALSLSGQANARECFQEPPGEPVKRVLEVRSDLREAYPLALTPFQRLQFLAWLLVHGQRDLGITPMSALWFLLEVDETPDRGLVPTYLLQPAWQAEAPLALTIFGWDKFKQYLRSKYGIKHRWLQGAKLQSPLRPWDQLGQLRQVWPQVFRDFPRGMEAVPQWLRRTVGVRRLPRRWMRGLREDAAAGLPNQVAVNVLGHYRYASGLQEACTGVAAALEGQGVRVARRDLPVNFPADWRDRERYQSPELFDTTIMVAAVNTFPKEYFARSGLRMREGVRRIAVWYWEVDRLPREWTPELAWANEVWAPTAFLAATYRNSVAVPVLPMLPGVALPKFEQKSRSFFRLPDDHRVILFSFDMGSVMARKNPLGLIEAYRRAFRADDRVHLCIKVSRGNCAPAHFAELKAACRSAGATLIDRVLPRGEVLALFDSANCYASLHRAEGLGLGMAESMLMGKPVVATAYSGNLDFMSTTNSFLVDAATVPIVDVPPYPPGSVWADPDLDHAAHLLRRVFDAPDEASEVARRGQSEVAELLSVQAAGERMLSRLKNLKA